MNYHEATSIAKQLPGSTVTRESSGLFIVRRQDGSVIKSFVPTDSPAPENLHREEISHLRHRLQELEIATRETDQLVEQLQSEIAKLKSKLSKVSQSERDRYKTKLDCKRNEMKSWTLSVTKLWETVN